MSLFKVSLTTLFVSAFLVGCAKEKEYETVHIEDKRVHQSKSLIENMCTVDDPCIYVPSVANTPYNVTASRPYWQGQEKIVIGKVTKDELKFLEVENDKRYHSNINNFSPVLSFGVDHIDYKCREDAYGDCTNAQEVDSEKPWENRRYLEINVGGFKVQEKNTLPIELGELFGQGCFSATDQEVTNVAIEKDAINLTIKKTYQSSPKCHDVEELRYLTFTVDYKYSIVKMSSLVDSSYPVVEYPVLDQSKFGFFKTELKSRTVDNLEHVVGVRKNLMNRWSPNKSVVTYYLNSDFFKPENKRILDVTKTGIESVNNSLKLAGAKFRIELKDGSNKDIGDLRNNFIILVSDPQASGVIGYGPSVANPNTGEILNARTVMYYGTIKKFVSSAYDELVEEAIQKYVASQGQVQTKSANVSNATIPKVSGIGQILLESPEAFSNYVEQRYGQIDYSSLGYAAQSVTSLDNLVDEKEYSFKDLVELSHNHDEKIMNLAKDTFYHGSNVNFSEVISLALDQTLNQGKVPPFWTDLDEEQRQKLIDELLPYVWVPTLVHEFGHNLGLRHNFYGSNDKKNYYTASERAALKIKKPITSSSIMDYSFRHNNELSVMGKYDVAALKFAYKREVVDETGKAHKVTSTIESMTDPRKVKNPIKLKSYQYCTDENTVNNALCNRFDEGDTYEAVADHFIDNIKKNYEKVNFRGRRYSYNSRSGDFNYLIYLFNNYARLRDFFGIYDQEVLNGSYNNPNWQQNPVLVSLKNSSDKVFNFLMDTIETPAYHCVEIDSTNNTVSRVLPFHLMTQGTKFSEINFDVRYGCRFLNIGGNGAPGKVYFEFGQYLNNGLDFLVDRSEISNYDNSEMDVRGMWMNKMIASMILTLRSTQPSNTIETSRGNFVDHKEYQDRFIKFIDGLLSDSFTKEVTILSGNGQPVTKTPVTYKFSNSHNINRSFNPFINGFFGLKYSRNNFSDLLFSIIKPNLKEKKTSSILDMTSLYDALDVVKLDTKVDISKYNFDKVVEFKDKSSNVLFRFGIYKENSFAMLLAKKKEIAETLAAYTPQQVKEAIDLLEGKVDAASVSSPSILEIAKLPKQALITYLSGGYNTLTILNSLNTLSI